MRSFRVFFQKKRLKRAISPFFVCFFFNFYILKVKKNNLVCITTKYPINFTEIIAIDQNFAKFGNALRTKKIYSNVIQH